MRRILVLAAVIILVTAGIFKCTAESAEYVAGTPQRDSLIVCDRETDLHGVMLNLDILGPHQAYEHYKTHRICRTQMDVEYIPIKQDREPRLMNKGRPGIQIVRLYATEIRLKIDDGTYDSVTKFALVPIKLKPQLSA